MICLFYFQVTEWPSTPEGEERQKNQMEEMYRILFDHPLVEAITGWDFTDGAWLNAPSGVLRKDHTIKPAYSMLKELIWDEWRTDYDVMTDENGYVEVEGFKGEYVLSAGTQKAEFKLDSKTNETKLMIQ